MFSYDAEPAGTRRWLATAAAGRLLLVDCAGDAEAAAAFAATVPDDASLALVLDRLAAGGLSSTPSFAAAAWDADGVTVIVRGAATATVVSADGATTVSAPQATTWIEERHPAATSVVLSGSTGGPGTPLPIGSGSVWASSITAPLGAANGAPERVAAAVAAPAVAAPAVAPPMAPATAEPESRPVPDTRAPEETQFFIDGDDDLDGAEAPPVDPANDEADLGYDYLFGQTVVRPVGAAAVHEPGSEAERDAAQAVQPAVQAAVPAPASSPVPEPVVPEPVVPADEATPLGDHDGHTIFAEDLAALRAGRAQQPQSQQTQHPQQSHSSPTPAVAPRMFLELPGGRRQSLDTPAVLGRAPSVSQVPASVVPALVTVAGEDISRSHVRVGVEGGTVVVTDLHSRNGTQVVLPGRDPQSLRPGEPTPVIVGTVIDLGGGVTLRVREG
ncbi:FHA domain-containing protein [Plantibacter sp. YIM 135249]|uniref:FHA domain-containing protein n=1 Tax=Plantibacter sp. YIM 135249 TaxID=3423918 RepID=UPI003D35796E